MGGKFILKGKIILSLVVFLLLSSIANAILCETDSDCGRNEICSLGNCFDFEECILDEDCDLIEGNCEITDVSESVCNGQLVDITVEGVIPIDIFYDFEIFGYQINSPNEWFYECFLNFNIGMEGGYIEVEHGGQTVSIEIGIFDEDWGDPEEEISIVSLDAHSKLVIYDEGSEGNCLSVPFKYTFRDIDLSSYQDGLDNDIDLIAACAGHPLYHLEGEEEIEEFGTYNDGGFPQPYRGYYSSQYDTDVINGQCNSGECCDFSTCNYQSSSYKCEEDVNTDYGCPWGTDPGDEVGVRNQDQYCSGSSSSCTGALVWDSWAVNDYCTSTETCINDNPDCQPVTCFTDYDCGIDGWSSDPFCNNNNVYQEFVTHTCINPGTSYSSCQQTYEDTLTEICAEVCSNGACMDVECHQDSECGTNGYIGSPSCDNGDVWQNYIEYSCQNPGTIHADCTNDITYQFKQSCANGCSDGSCIGITCNQDEDCGTDTYIDNPYCSNDNVVQDHKVYECNNPGTGDSYCIDHTNTQVIEDCETTCSDGACNIIHEDQELLANNSYSVSDDDGAYYYATSFIVEEIITINKITLSYSASDTYNIRVETDNNGEPSGTLAHVNLDVSEAKSSPHNTPLNFTFVNPGTLNPGTYWIVTNRPSGKIWGGNSEYDGNWLKAGYDKDWFQNIYLEDMFFQVWGTKQTTIICNQDSDCGTDDYIDNPYCSNDDVYQNYRTYTCENPGTSNSVCSNTENPQLKEDCLNICENAACTISEQGYLWNADATNDKIYKLTTDGNIISSFDSPGPAPRGLTWDGNYLWNSDSSTDTIYKLDTNGNILDSFDSFGTTPYGLTYDGQYLRNLDKNTKKVMKLTVDGTFIDNLDIFHTDSSGLTYDGQDLWFSSYGMDMIYQITTNRDPISEFNSPSGSPTGLTWDGQYLWNSDEGIDKIYRLTTGGNIISSFDSPGPEPYGLAWQPVSEVIGCNQDSDCGTDDYIDNPYCSNDDIYQNYRTYTCTDPGIPNSACSNQDLPQLKEDCTDTCENGICVDIICSADVDCDDSNDYTEDTCIDPGTPNSNCNYESITCLNDLDCDDQDSNTIDTCSNPGTIQSSCSNEVIVCNQDEDCGTDSYTGNEYCDNNDVYQNYQDFTCENPGTPQSSCSNIVGPELIEDCTDTCLDGVCVNIECNQDEDCGTDAYMGDPFCSNDDIVQDYIFYSCNNPGTGDSYCSDHIATPIIEVCETTCVDGQCNTINEDQELLANNSYSVSDDDGAYYYATSFTTSSIINISKITLSYSASDTYNIRVETDNNGEPSGTLAHVNLDVSEAKSSPHNTPLNFTFVNPGTLNPGTYWIVTNRPSGRIWGGNSEYDGNWLKAGYDKDWFQNTYLEDMFFQVWGTKQTTIICNQDEDCGTDSYTGNEYCDNNDVYQNYQDFTCENPGTPQSSCSNIVGPELIEDCTDTCLDGVCVNIECNQDEDCGTDTYIDDSYCNENNVWQNYRTYTCNNPGTPNAACSNTEDIQLKEECNDLCETGICLSSDISYIWNADATDDKIYKLTTEGNIISSFNSPGPAPRGLTWDGTYLWNSDSSTDKIYRLDASGNILDSFNSFGTTPYGLTWDGENLWELNKIDQYIYQFTTDGTLLHKFDTDIANSVGLTWDGEYLWFSSYGMDMIYQITTNRDPISEFNSPSGSPTGLTWDGQYLWNSDYNAAKIYKLTTDGTIISSFDSPGPDPYGLAWQTEAIVCNQDSNCGDNEWREDSYCNNNDIYQDYRTYICYNPGTLSSYCSYSEAEQLKEDCIDTCQDSTCINLQEISLTTGWNEITFEVLPQDRSLSNVLNEIDGKYSQIKTLEDGNLRLWDENFPDFANDLTEIKYSKSYLINMKQDHNLNIIGERE